MINYMHICSNTTTCKCGWVGCFCEATHSSKKVSESLTEIIMYQHCPKCNNIVSTSTLTTNTSI